MIFFFCCLSLFFFVLIWFSLEIVPLPDLCGYEIFNRFLFFSDSHEDINYSTLPPSLLETTVSLPWSLLLTINLLLFTFFGYCFWFILLVYNNNSSGILIHIFYFYFYLHPFYASGFFCYMFFCWSFWILDWLWKALVHENGEAVSWRCSFYLYIYLDFDSC